MLPSCPRHLLALLLVAPALASAQLPQISLDSVSPGNEDGTPTLYTFKRTGDLTQPLELHYIISGAAIPYHDILPGSETLTFRPGSALATAVVESLDDDFAEIGKTILLRFHRTDTADIPPDLIWIEPPPLPQSITDQLARLDPLLRRQMPPLTHTPPIRLAACLSFSRPGSQLGARLTLPPDIQRDIEPFLKQGMEVILQTSDTSALWTLAYSEEGGKTLQRLTRYIAPGESHSLFPRLQLYIDPSTALTRLFALLPSPRPGPTQRFTLSTSEEKGPIAEYDLPLRKTTEPLLPDLPIEAQHQLNPRNVIAPEHLALYDRVLLPALASIGAAAPAQLSTAFPDVLPAAEDVESARSLLAQSEPAAPTLAQTHALAHLVANHLLSKDALVRAQPLLASAGWCDIPTSDLAARQTYCLRALQQYPDARICSRAEILLAARHLPTTLPALPLLGIPGPCVPGEQH